MQMTLEQKLDAFERWLRQTSRGTRDYATFTNDELYRAAGQLLRSASGWDGSIGAADLVQGLRGRWQQKAALTRKKNRPRRREAKLAKQQKEFQL